MKKSFLFASCILVCQLALFSQVPNAFRYQAVVRNEGQVVANSPIGILVKLIQGSAKSTVVYTELQNTTSNEYGVISLSIGEGTSPSGSFSSIDWSKGPYFLETNVDINGGTNYQISGSVELLSVPYALFSNKTRNADQLIVQGNDIITGDSALFVVKDKKGNAIFSVYETSVEVSFNEGSHSKGAKGGFSVGGRSTAKGTIETILQVSADSIRMYVDTAFSKGSKSGFSVGGRGGAKGANDEYFSITGNRSLQIVNPSQSRIYWYPRKEAFLTGRVLVESSDSVGTNSTATGFESKAIGNWSQALGYKTVARNNYSTAIGKNALASGLNSFAFGDGAKALNDDAYAFGAMTEARGRGSFAFGYVGRDSLGPTGHITTALGDWSFAFGLGAKASQPGDFAFGVETKASGGFSTALGFQTMAKGWNAMALGDSTVASGTVSVSLGYKTIASGWTSLAINQENEASGGQSFAGGYLSKATEGCTFAFGYKNIASNWLATALGQQTKASGAKALSGGNGSIAGGECSFSFGNSDTASGFLSVSFGNVTRSTNRLSFTIGESTLASGAKSFAGGTASIASDEDAFSFGYKTNASGWNSVAFGDSTGASGGNSFACGYQSISQGWSSFSAGNNSYAKGDVSSAIGSNTKAFGGGSFVMGYGASSYGFNSFSGGDHSISLGSNSIAFGLNAKAIGNSSICFGNSTKSKAFASLVIGQYNDTSGVQTDWFNGTDPAFVIGNGWTEASRSNAFTVLQNGKTAIGLVLPTEMLDVNGNARFRSVKSGGSVSALYIDENGVLTTSTSDESLKHNFIPLTGALDKVKEMNGLYYSWKSDPQNKRRLGFIAQEMEKIVPEAVFTNPTDGLKGVNYAELAAIFAQAIKEQQNLFENMQIETQLLRNQNQELMQRIEKLEKSMEQKSDK